MDGLDFARLRWVGVVELDGFDVFGMAMSGFAAKPANDSTSNEHCWKIHACEKGFGHLFKNNQLPCGVMIVLSCNDLVGLLCL